MLHRWLVRWFAGAFLALAVLAPRAADAADVKVAVVDFQKALEQTNDGIAAMARLEGMRDEKMKVLERKRQALTTLQTELRNQAGILSEAARAAKEEEFMRGQAELQQLAMQSEADLQNSYMSTMDELIGNLRSVAEEIGREKGYNLIFENTESGVVFSSGVDDITAELVRRYNARHPR